MNRNDEHIFHYGRYEEMRLTEKKKVNSRAGHYVQNLSGEAEYQSFLPSPLPPVPPISYDNELASLLSSAHRRLGLLEGLSSQIPDVGLFMAMYVRKEALMSSQIEGTQATLEDVLSHETDANANRDVKDVVNYVKATEIAIELLKELPLCCRFMRRVHAVLMSGVRGEEKYPGEFRRSQNWIGGAGSTIKTARYVPPNPEDMKEAMSLLEKYMNDEEDTTDELIRIALIHYQFETIHPFLDGNGRVGRLMITLYLMEKGLLTLPSLYISYYLKKNRIEYYDRMTAVRLKGDYEQWVKFFLNALVVSSDSAIETIKDLSELHEKNYETVKGMGKSSSSALKVFCYLEKSPIITVSKTAHELGLSVRTVSLSVKKLQEAGILYLGEKATRCKVYYYRDYLCILRSGTE